MKELKEVDEQISKVIKKNKNELDTALIKPIHKAHPFSSSFEKLYYNLIVFCSTSNGLDKTVLAFKDQIKTPIMFISDTELIDFLNEHVKQKMRYYSIYRYVMSNFKKADDTMTELIRTHGLNIKEKIIKFIAQELNEYQTNRYPLNCLVVLDDFANNKLLTK